MRTIYKYSVPIDDIITMSLPEGARPLHFGTQAARVGEYMVPQLYLWAEVDTGRQERLFRFRMAGTGHDLDVPSPGFLTKRTYINTVQMHGLVFHFFLLEEP